MGFLGLGEDGEDGGRTLLTLIEGGYWWRCRERGGGGVGGVSILMYGLWGEDDMF